MPVDVHKVIDDTFALMEGPLNKNIRLVKKLSAPAPIVAADETLLQNAFLNIAINARDAMESGGTLTFETAAVALDASNHLCQSFQISPGEYISIAVSDTGTGMNEEIQRHLFEPFFTTKPKGKGTGFGLANVWGFIENYKGAITVTSKEGAGSTFTLFLPQLIVEVPDNQAAPSTASGISLTIDNVKTILVVDDELAQREISREMLHDKGFSVVFSENGLEAVNFVRDNKKAVDLIIMDLKMPVMDGRDAFFEIRKLDPEMKILIASGYINNKELQGIMSERKTGFLQKPFSGDMLIGAIEKLSKED
jgi:CheY-like chemotaxis protein